MADLPQRPPAQRPVPQTAVLITVTGARKLAHLGRHLGRPQAEVLELGLNALAGQLGLAVGADGGPAVHRPDQR